MNACDYTKGEWKSRHPINNDYTIYTGEYGEGIIQVAMVSEFSPNAEANARLIAAAPDLYKACNEATMWVAKMSADGSTIAGRVLIRMRKALAKAES